MKSSASIIPTSGLRVEGRQVPELLGFIDANRY